MSECTTTIGDLDVEVEYEFSPGEDEVRYYPGRRGGLPNGDGHPGCDASIDLLYVWLGTAEKRIDILDCLPADAIEGIKESCMEDVERQARSAREDMAERAWEEAHA